MADVEVTLGARNEATATLRQFSQQVNDTATQVEFSFRGLMQLAGLTAAIVGVVEGARAIAGFASSSLNAFDDLNRSASKLTETINLLPNGSQAASDGLKKVANSLELMTNVDAGKIMESMAGSLRRGAGLSAIEDMTEAALGLSRVFDRDLESAMRMVESATQGNFEAFEGLIPNIDEMTTLEEKLAAVSALATEGLRNKAKSAKEAVEANEALKIATDNMYETFGALIAPIRDVIYRGLVVMAEYIQKSMVPALDDFIGYSQQLADSMGEFALYIAESFVKGFTMAEVAIWRFNDVLEIIKSSVLLTAHGIYNDAIHVFKNLGDRAAWFVEWYSSLFTSMFSGDGPNYTFEDLYKNMPQLGDRVATETEKGLRESLGSATERLTDDYDKKVKERLSALKDELGFNIDIGLKPKDGAGQSLSDELRQLTAFESRVLVRGQTDSPIAKIAENTSQMVKEQQKTNEIIGVTVSPTPETEIEIIE